MPAKALSITKSLFKSDNAYICPLDPDAVKIYSEPSVICLGVEIFSAKMDISKPAGRDKRFNFELSAKEDAE